MRREGRFAPHRQGNFRPVALDQVGSVAHTHLPFLHNLVCQKAHETESELQTRLVQATAAMLARDEILIVDAGFGMQALLPHPEAAILTRLDQNITARRNFLPPCKGRGKSPWYAAIVRPLSRT